MLLTTKWCWVNGVDLHKRYATISIRNEHGKEIERITKCVDFKKYIDSLTSEDAVLIEAVNNAFYYSEIIEEKGAVCLIVNSHKFKIISESFIKTDKKDASTLSLGLWVSLCNEEFRLPVIHKPSAVTRELRRLFGQYQLINKQVRQYRNIIQAHLAENGIVLTEPKKKQLFNHTKCLDVFKSLELNHSTRICVIMNVYLLCNLFDQKEIIRKEIYKVGTPLKDKVKLLITIKGVSPLLALAFLADVDDITRFINVRKFNSYLGVVPKVKSSGDKTQMGHINRQSRNLSRTLYSQSIIHFVKNSPNLYCFYEDVKIRRGANRSRIAVLRKIFSIMRRMLLSCEEYKWKDENNYKDKLYKYELELARLENLANVS